MSVLCPVCQRVILKPRPPLLRSVPWGECACTDDGPCVAHQFDAADMPKRPDPKVLAKRAQDEHAHRTARYEDTKRRVAAYEKLRRERDALLKAATCTKGWYPGTRHAHVPCRAVAEPPMPREEWCPACLAVAACEEGGEG